MARYKDFQRADLIYLVQQGKSKGEMCEILGISLPTLNKALEYRGVRHTPSEKVVPLGELAAMLKWGYTQKDIASILGVNPMTVGSWVKKYKVKEALGGVKRSVAAQIPTQVPVPIEKPIRDPYATRRQFALPVEPEVKLDELQDELKLFEVVIPAIGARFAVKAHTPEEAQEYIKSKLVITELKPLTAEV